MVQSAKDDVPTNPSADNQWDEDTPTEEKFSELYAMADKLKISLLGTQRPGIGCVFRSMAVAKRVGE